MEPVGKLIRDAAITMFGQPWLELVYPACCVSCNKELLNTAEDGDAVVGSRVPAAAVANEADQAVVCSAAEEGLDERKLDNSSPAGTTLAQAIPRCNGSLTPLAFYQWQELHWCHGCWTNLNQHPTTRCEKCAAGLARPSPFPQRCFYCLRSKLKFDGALALGNYRGLLRELVVRMKNQHDDVLANHLGQRLGYELLGQGWTDFDRLIPVPIHWSRRLKRGFQATDILSDQISRLTGIPKCDRTVSVVRVMSKQGTLSKAERVANVRNAFSVKPKAFQKGERILLVDDVLTSGATTSELARILKLQGAAEVKVAVVVRGGVG